MGLSATVFVGNITNLSDARYCAGMGVDYLGFPIDPLQKQALDHEAFSEICQWVSGVKIIGEVWENVPETFAVDGYRISNPALVDAIRNTGKPYIYSISAKDDPGEIQSLLSYIRPQLITITDVSSVDEVRNLPPIDDVPVLVEGIQTPERLPQFLNLGFAGFHLSGSTEEKPGQKDYDLLADVLEALES